MTDDERGKLLTDKEREKIRAILSHDAKLLAEFDKKFPPSKAKSKTRYASRGAVVDSVGTGTAGAPSGASAGTVWSTTNKNSESKFYFLVRNNWSDLGLLAGCFGSSDDGTASQDKTANQDQAGTPGSGGVTAGKAQGASLSFTQDYVAANRLWAAQGMVAGVYSSCRHFTLLKDTGWTESTIAAYGQVNASYNSSAALASKNTSTTTAGLSGETAFLTQDGDFNVGRITPNVVQNEIKNTTAVAVMGQYIPVWISQWGIWHTTYLFGGFTTFQFDPTLDLQYADTSSNKPLLFSGRNDALRIGPELTLIASPFAGSDSFLKYIGLNITFHPWYEAVSSQGNYWWTNAVTYKLSQNFSIGASYSRGLDENSGMFTNQYMVTLNGKL